MSTAFFLHMAVRLQRAMSAQCLHIMMQQMDQYYRSHLKSYGNPSQRLFE